MAYNQITPDSRKQQTREPRYKDGPPDLQEILASFKNSITGIRTLFGLAEELEKEGKKEQAEHIWRAQIVFLVSTLDYYMHGLNRFGLWSMYNGDWDKSKDYKNLTVKMEFIEKALKYDNNSSWFIDNINDIYGNKSMVNLHCIELQFELIGISEDNVFGANPSAKAASQSSGCVAAAAAQISRDEDDNKKEKLLPTPKKNKLKQSVKSLVQVRNIIAHQANIPSKGAKVPKISAVLVEQFIRSVEELVNAINTEAEKKLIQHDYCDES